jgi:hypothetical protein
LTAPSPISQVSFLKYLYHDHFLDGFKANGFHVESQSLALLSETNHETALQFSKSHGSPTYIAKHHKAGGAHT